MKSGEIMNTSRNKRRSRENIIICVECVVLLACVVFFCSFFLNNKKQKNYKICEKNYCMDYDRIISKNLNLDTIETTAKKVMFVAHPDDETLWGSAALYQDKYLVVCVTCGTSKKRVLEFKEVMFLTEDDFIMLGYPDLVKGKKSNWEKEWDNINSDIQKILSLKDWDLVVTHNPDGEYGHIHHKMTNKIVTEYAAHDKLSYFGRFYWGKIPNEETLYRLTDEEFDFKTKTLIPVYKTQVGAINNLKNMVHYESWISYKDWYGEDNA